jgi:hypothetical protein
MRDNSGIKAYIDQGMMTIWNKLPSELNPNTVYYVKKDGNIKIYQTDLQCKLHEAVFLNEEVEQPPLTGHWHHGNGVIVSGGTRIAKEDFDCQPVDPVFRDELFDWICKTLNKEIDLYYANRSNEDANS